MNFYKWGVLVVFGAVLMASFQNCSQSYDIQLSSKGQKLTGSPTPTPSPINCPAGYTYDGTSCVPQSTACLSYVEITSSPGAAVSIPARDGTQTCYFIHMIKAVSLGNPVSATQWKTFRNDIVSRYHNTSTDTAIQGHITGSSSSHSNANPRVIGSTENAGGGVNTGAVGSAQFFIQGTRIIMLGGNSAGNIPMKVDNFILLEMHSNTLGQTYLAEGTADALPFLNPMQASDNSTAPITVNGQSIPFISFGAGGTTDITPKDISSYLPINDPVTVTVTGLDCGGVGNISDIYILFQ